MAKYSYRPVRRANVPRVDERDVVRVHVIDILVPTKELADAADRETLAAFEDGVVDVDVGGVGFDGNACGH